MSSCTVTGDRLDKINGAVAVAWDDNWR